MKLLGKVANTAKGKAMAKASNIASKVENKAMAKLDNYLYNMNNTSNNKMYWYVGAGILALVLLIILIVLLTSNNKESFVVMQTQNEIKDQLRLAKKARSCSTTKRNYCWELSKENPNQAGLESLRSMLMGHCGMYENQVDTFECPDDHKKVYRDEIKQHHTDIARLQPIVDNMSS